MQINYIQKEYYNDSNSRLSIFYTKIVVIVDQLYFAVASGKLIDQIQIEDKQQIVYEYQLNRDCDPDDLGIFIGIIIHPYFYHTPIFIYSQGQFSYLHCTIPLTIVQPLEEADQEFLQQKGYSYITILHSPHINQDFIRQYVFGKELQAVIGGLDRYWFKDPLIKPIRDQLNINTLSSALRGTVWVMLPSRIHTNNDHFYTYRSIGPFESIVVTDESFISQQLQQSMHMEQRLRVHLNDQFNMLILGKFLCSTSNVVQDGWVIEALGHLVGGDPSDKVEERVVRQCEIGGDVLIDESGCQMVSKEFENKSWMLGKMLSRLTHSYENYVKQILVKVYEEDKGRSRQSLSGSNLIKLTKKVFGITKLKYFQKMYINSSGAVMFRIHYSYQKTEHKLNFTVSQQPLQRKWAYMYTQNRIKGEQQLGAISAISQQYLNIEERIQEINDLIKKSHKEKEMHTKEQMRNSGDNLLRKNQLNQVLHQQIREQEKREIFEQIHAIVPKEVNQCFFFSGQVRVRVHETNELELRSEDYPIKVEGRPIVKIDVNCRQRIKKLNIPKRHQEINAASYLQQDENKIGGILPSEQIDNDALVQSQMIHGILGEALMKSGANVQLVKDLSSSIQKEPPLWVKWDPEGCLIRYVESENQDENSVLCQILKEKDMNHVCNLILTLRNNGLRAKVLKLIVEIIETSYTYLKSDVVCELIIVLSKLVNKNLNIEQIDEEINQLDLYSKMIEKILYRFFFNQNDNSVKYNEFQNSMREYLIVLSCIKGLQNLQSSSIDGLDQTLMLLILTITEYQDNQYNQYSNNYIIAKLLSLIMHTNCQKYKFQALQIIRHQLQQQSIAQTNDCYILYKIIRHFKHFLSINFNDNFKSQSIIDILDLISLHQTNPLAPIISIAFYKDHLDQQWNQYKIKSPYLFVLIEIVSINELRFQSAAQSLQFKTKLSILNKFISRNYNTFALEQSSSDNNKKNIELSKALASTLWDCMIYGPSLIDYEIQNYYSSIYKTLYYYWAPLCYLQIIKERITNNIGISNSSTQQSQQQIPYLMFTEFQVDENWFTSEWNHLLKETSKIKNFYGVQLRKRQRPTIHNQHFDTYQQLSKFVHRNPSRANEREITKWILKFISQLPQIRDIEEKMRLNDLIKQQNNTSFNFKFSLKLDQVKMQMKRRFEGMDVTQKSIINVITSYHEKGQISQTHKDEYVQLVKNLFLDGIKVLDENLQQNQHTKSQFIPNPYLQNVDTVVSIQRPKQDETHSLRKEIKSNQKKIQNTENQYNLDEEIYEEPHDIPQKIQIKMQPSSNKISFKIN